MKAIQFLFLLLPFYINAQSHFHGQVITTEKTPLENAVVAACNADTVILNTTMTHSDGSFSIESAPTPTFLLFSHLAYQNQIVIPSTSANIGTIIMKPQNVQLAEWTISAESPHVKMKDGKICYAAMPIYKNFPVDNAFEIITKLPGITERANSLLLFGKNNVEIIIDGKPQTLTQEQIIERLKSLPPHRVKDIEISYNGNPQLHTTGPLINVNTSNVSPESYEIETAIHYNHRHQSNSTDAKISLSFSKKKTTLNITYNPLLSDVTNSSNLHSCHQIHSKIFDIYQSQSIHTTGWFHNLYTDVSYKFSPQATLTLGYDSKILPKGKGNICTQSSLADSRNDKRQNSYLHNFALTFDWKESVRISAIGTLYSFFDNNNLKINNLNGQNSNILDYDSRQTIRKFCAFFDWKHPIGDVFTLSAGAKYEYVRNHNAQTFNPVLCSEIPYGTDSKSKITEQTTNLYVGLHRSFSDRFSLSGSINAETYILNRNTSWLFFPLISLSYTPASHHFLSLNLSAHKNYPNYWDMQSNITYMNAYEEIHTTDELRPSTSYEIAANYLFKGKYSATIFFNHTNRYFTMDIYQHPECLAFIYRTQNWNYMRTIGINIGIPLSYKRLNSLISCTINHEWDKSNEICPLPFKRAKWSCLMAMDNNLTLPHNFSISLDANYMSPTISGHSNIKSNFSVNLGVELSCLNDRAKLRLKCSDLFNTSAIQVYDFSDGQHFQLNMNRQPRNISLSFSFRLGDTLKKDRQTSDTSRFGIK